MKKTAPKTERGFDIVNKDPYLPRGASGKVGICEGCNAVYRNKRWYAGLSEARAEDADAVKVVCPACLKIRDDFPEGIVTLTGGYALTHKQEVLNLVKNEEIRARGFNPLERVMSIRENGYGGIVISTTNEKLAQRIGRALKKAFHGEVKYQWSRENKLVRVDWMREAA
ncbi:MAG: BCAM0308 family protein [Nitrospiraceae bacterium]|nr:BCAM0308 family protein [Nitrospiraceae bacterium]